MSISRAKLRRAATLLAVLVCPMILIVGCPAPGGPGSVPKAPSGLSGAAVSATTISLSWQDTSSNETGFKVKRKTGSGGAYALAATLPADTTAYSDAGLAASTNYFYKVCAFNDKGDSSDSNEISVATLSAPPVAPSALIATPTSSTSIRLDWTDNSSDETGFTLERSTTSAASGYTTVTTTLANVVTFADTGLAPSQNYWYRVQAVGAGGGSDYSNTTSASTSTAAPRAPTGLVLSRVTASSVTLTWNDTSSNETGFVVERSTTSATNGFSGVATPVPNSTTWTDASVTSNLQYWYRVKATGLASNDSAFTTAVGIWTLLQTPSTPTANTILYNSVSLSWTCASSGVSGFTIQRSTTSATSNFSTVATVGGTVTTCTDSANLNTHYWYRVKANGSNSNDSAYSGALSVYTLVGTPSGLISTAVGTVSLTVLWGDVSGETGYSIERSSTSGSAGFNVVGSTAANVANYNDAGLTQGTNYWYRVKALGSYGNDSAYSSALAVTTMATPLPPSALTATATGPRAIHLAWQDNSSNETGFTLESSITSATSGFSVVASLAANTIVYNHASGISPLVTRWYRVKATLTSGVDSAYSSVVTVTPPAPVAAQAFKVVNSWGKGYWENIADGFYWITYSAFKNAQIWSMFFDDLNAYNPTLLVTLKMTHPVRGDCFIQVGLGTHANPVQLKTFSTYSWFTSDNHAFPSNVMALDISEFAANINSYDLFLRVWDYGTDDPPGTASTGIINSFTVEKYTTYGGTHSTLTATGLPRATTNAAWTYADIHTAGVIGAPALSAMAAPSKIASLVNSHPMTDAELSDLKRNIGVADKNKNYNIIIKGFGTGLRPPTEEQWAQIQKNTMIIDSLKSPPGPVGLPPSVDFTATNNFPPIGDQGSQGSCVAWSTAYYMKTWQEAHEHNWNLSTVQTLGSYPSYYPDSQLNHIFSPTWVYNQINGGVDTGAYFDDAADILCNLGAATWQTVPYTVYDATSWAPESGWREAPPYRGKIPVDGEWGMHYYLSVKTDAQITILKTLLANNVPVSISIDANKFSALSTDDVWDTSNYVSPSPNHANTLVGYHD